MAVEIMGRHSNVIVVGPDGKILDAVKRIDRDMSGVRPILPGMTYTLPPQQEKLNLLTAQRDKIRESILNAKAWTSPKVSRRPSRDFPPVLAREAAFYATRGQQAG